MLAKVATNRLNLRGQARAVMYISVAINRITLPYQLFVVGRRSMYEQSGRERFSKAQKDHIMAINEHKSPLFVLKLSAYVSIAANITY
eukprot:scaffold333662_cov17-Prasinocladus_malaysianus.AAC.1